MTALVRRLSTIFVLALVAAGLCVVAVPAAQAAMPAEGAFVRAPGTSSQVYRIAGGAPLPITSWAAVGMTAPETAPPRLTSAEWSALKVVPNNGTFLRAYSGSTVYVVAGGAPIQVTRWANLYADGQARPTIVVDKAAIDRAGQAAPWNRLRPVPATDTYLRAKTSTNLTGVLHRVYQGRAYRYYAAVPSGRAVVSVDAVALARCNHVDCRPFGALESVTAVGPDSVRIRGWAMDPDATRPVSLTYTVDGAPRSGPANAAFRARPDIDAVWHGGAAVGFEEVVAVPGGAPRRVCVFGSDTSGTGGLTDQQELGCHTVALGSASPLVTTVPDKVKRPRVKSLQRRAVVNWKPPSDGGSPILKYRVKASTGKDRWTKGKQTKRTKLVFKGLRTGRSVTFKVCAFNARGLGECSRSSKKVRIR